MLKSAKERKKPLNIIIQWLAGTSLFRNAHWLIDINTPSFPDIDMASIKWKQVQKMMQQQHCALHHNLSWNVNCAEECARLKSQLRKRIARTQSSTKSRAFFTGTWYTTYNWLWYHTIFGKLRSHYPLSRFISSCESSLSQTSILTGGRRYSFGIRSYKLNNLSIGVGHGVPRWQKNMIACM